MISVTCYHRRSIMTRGHNNNERAYWNGRLACTILRTLLVFRTCLVGGNALLSSSTTSFAPFPPPSFDVFSEKMVCSWTSTRTDQKKVVEEVMRSCGGAVQGIREPFIVTTTNENEDDKAGLYLNRANDGFVFYDHGDYSLGPVNWKNTETDDSCFLASLRFGTTRLLLSSKQDPILLEKTFGGDGSTASLLLATDIDPTNNAYDASRNIQFDTKIRCSMPSPTQPWMLQRAKWDRQVIPQDDRERKDESPLLQESVHCWIMDQPSSDFYQWITGNDSTTITSVEEQGRVIHMGAFCEATGVVKAVSRHYNPSNSLISVLFLEGCGHYNR